MYYIRMSDSTITLNAGPKFPIPTGEINTALSCKGCNLKITYKDTKFEKTYCPKSGCPLPYEFSYKCSRCSTTDKGEFILDNFPKYPNHNLLCKCGKQYAYTLSK